MNCMLLSIRKFPHAIKFPNQHLLFSISRSFLAAAGSTKDFINKSSLMTGRTQDISGSEKDREKYTC